MTSCVRVGLQGDNSRTAKTPRTSILEKTFLQQIKNTCISPFLGRATPLTFTDEIEILPL
jgi:hypothetical protein